MFAGESTPYLYKDDPLVRVPIRGGEDAPEVVSQRAGLPDHGFALDRLGG
jgi:hypothetical protein